MSRDETRSCRQQTVYHLRVVPWLPLRLSEPARLALLRLPAELTGATPEVQTAARAPLIDPVAAAALADQQTAIDQARKLVQHAINELAKQSGLEPADLIRTFGQDARNWELPGITETLKARLVKDAEPPEETA